MKSQKPKRFAVGARVRICSPGINGVVVQADDDPSIMAEYWHTVECQINGETRSSRQNGGNLELVPVPVTNEPKQSSGSATFNRQLGEELLEHIQWTVNSRITPLEWTEAGKKMGFSESETANAVRWLKSEELIEFKPGSQAFAITRLGNLRLEALKRMHAPGPTLDSPLPESLKDVQADLAHWETRQHESDPGSSWWTQVDARLTALRHKEHRLIAAEQKPPAPTINQYGHGSRTYVGSHDHSVNFVATSMEDVFKQVRDQIAALVPDTTCRDNILERLDELEAAQNTPSWMERYTQFMAVASDHITVLGWMLPPLLERLMNNHHIS